QMPIPDHLTRRVPEFLFKEPVNIKRRVLRDGVGFLTENWADMEKYEVITRLYNQNGLRNISYHTMRIDPAELKKGILPHFLEEVGNRPTYIISFDAEKQWPFVLARLYKTMQSKGLDVSMADQGRTDPINFSWDVVDCYLELTGTDRTNFFKCAQDDSSVNHPGEWDLPEGSEHGRDIHGFPRIGRAIKLGMADALAKYVQGGVMKNTNPNQRKWADPTYFVRARGL
ncbi:MAG: hypothetical protein QF632_03945, partial [Candidatus Woesearchaeota archaeon]|nr:hypothetical protein [Candidatus Woesearchaeota archaeon]